MGFTRLPLFLLLAVGCAPLRPIQEAPRALLAPPCSITFWTAQCDDGVCLRLQRYQSKSGARAGSVVLCHGMGFNANVFDLDDQHRLARYLGGEGLDVWAPDLRGAGLSQTPRRSWDWTLEDYVHHDVPAILTTVRKLSGRHKVVWVGHNLGAIVALAYAAAHPEEDGLSIVSVGASVTGQQPPPSVVADAQALARLMDPRRRFPSLHGGWAASVPKGWEALFYNPEHMSRETLATMARVALSPVSPSVARQFLSMLRGGDLRSADGKINYAAEMGKVRRPVLFMCGKADNLADVGSVRRLYQTVASPDKEFRLFCLMNGDGADFGNADLLLGPRASVDVYPAILRWTNKHL